MLLGTTATCRAAVRSNFVDEPLVELARRKKGQAPPPSVVWQAIQDPSGAGDRRWFDVGPGETLPVILGSSKPHTVTWSSVWLDEPKLRIEFQIDHDRGGSMVTWTLVGPTDALDEEDVRRRRHRLNELINGRLRETFDQ